MRVNAAQILMIALVAAYLTFLLISLAMKWSFNKKFSKVMAKEEKEIRQLQDELIAELQEECRSLRFKLQTSEERADNAEDVSAAKSAILLEREEDIAALHKKCSELEERVELELRRGLAVTAQLMELQAETGARPLISGRASQ